MRLLLLLFLATACLACDSCDSDNLPPPAAEEGEYPRNQEDYSTTEETTGEPEAESSTWNRFNEAGWQTDKSGNVFIGDDNAKLYLISVGSYWPFPKDYK